MVRHDELGGWSAVPLPAQTSGVGSVVVLDGIRVSWEWLCAAPHPVTVAGGEIAGLPDRRIGLGELRSRLLDPASSREVRDAAWRYLITRSRTDGATWTVACAGMALPMLAAAVRECTTRGAGAADREDVASAVVAGFVAGLATVDIDRCGITTSLRWTALRAGLAVVRDALDAPRVRPHDDLVTEALSGDGPGTGSPQQLGQSGFGSAPPAGRSGHPDLVLAAAVDDGVITAAEAELIGETRLQRVPLAVVAARVSRPVGTITMRRIRAELRLVTHLLGPDSTHHTAHHTHRPGTGEPRRLSRSVPDSDSRSGSAEPAPAAGRDAAPAPITSPSVSGRRRRRTRGARRSENGSVAR